MSQRDPVYRFPVTGTPRDLVVDRGVVAWRAFSGTRFGIAWCRLERNGRPARSRGKGASSVAPIDCTEQIVAIGPGNLSLPHVGRGWLVWQRDDGASRIIEGCYVGRRSKQCDPVPLVDLTQGSRWQLRSFDGYSLLLQEGAGLARCLISRGGGTCAPEPILMAIGAPSITEVVHDKGLLVLGETALSVQPSLGLSARGVQRELPPELRSHAPVLRLPTRRSGLGLRSDPDYRGRSCGAFRGNRCFEG